jgi:hypothetical protein
MATSLYLPFSEYMFMYGHTVRCRDDELSGFHFFVAMMEVLGRWLATWSQICGG